MVEHHWDGASYYSLYAHLASAAVEPGMAVTRGTKLGIMGHTGAGIDRPRSHVHLELNLLLSRHFDAWYDNFIKNEPNRHGLYNGVNLIGIDIAKFYLAQRRQPGLTVPHFLAGEQPFYKVLLPPSANFDLPRRYPWLLSDKPASPPASWEISFNRAGVPLHVAPNEKSVSTPVLSFVRPARSSYSGLTRGVVTGSGKNARLSESGLRLMRLLIWPD
ncbi:MAG: M23 family metallopeptidase [Chthoniobacterales bacterium]